MTTKTVSLFRQSETLFRIFGITLLCIALMTSCKNDDDPVTPVSLNPATLSVLTDATEEVAISGGTAPYTISTNSNQAVATAVISGTTLTVTGVSEGTTDITVVGSDGSNAKLSVAVSDEPATLITVAELRAKLTSGESVTLPKSIKIKGAVISDADSKNIDSKTVVLQEDNVGIIIQFEAAHALKVGEEAEITVSKLTLARENGELSVKEVPVANGVKTGNKAITPIEKTAAEVIEKASELNGTLVKLPAGYFTGGSGNYNGTISYDDGTATVKSTFIATDFGAYPVAGAASLTGIVRISGSDVFINIRNKQDVAEKGGYVIVEDFSTADAGYYVQEGWGSIYPYIIESDVWTPLAGIGESPFYAASETLWEINTIGDNNNDPDASFLEKGRNYARILVFNNTTAANPNIKGTGGVLYDMPIAIDGIKDRFYGAKSVTVIYALSNANSNTFSPANRYLKNDMELNDFNATEHSITFRWNNMNNDQFSEDRHKIEAQIISEPATERGVWYTFKADNFKEIMTNKSSNNNTVGLRVLSDNRGTVSITNSSNQVQSREVKTFIIIDKIIWEWDEKPTWAN